MMISFIVLLIDVQDKILLLSSHLLILFDCCANPTAAALKVLFYHSLSYKNRRHILSMSRGPNKADILREYLVPQSCAGTINVCYNVISSARVTRPL